MPTSDYDMDGIPSRPSPFGPVGTAGPVPQAAVRRFPEHERRFLLSQPRIGDNMVKRLENLGFHSLADLRRVGASEVVAICEALGSIAWANRRRALANALTRSITQDTR